jgi:hypothetical protein
MATTTDTTQDTAHSQALAQVESIKEMVAALEVDYDRLEELREFKESEGLMNPEAMEELAELEAAAGDCESQEDAQQRISEDPLSVQVRSDWANPGETMEAAEFQIVLCTGGPHVEIVGELDQYGEPDRVRILYRDWGTSGELYDFDRRAVLAYCRQFHYAD